MVRAEATGAISDPLGQTVKFKDGPVVAAKRSAITAPVPPPIKYPTAIKSAVKPASKIGQAREQDGGAQ